MFNQNVEILRGERRTLLLNGRPRYVCDSLLSHQVALQPESAANRGARRPMDEPFMEHGRLVLRDAAGIHDAGISQRLIAEEEMSQPVQHIVVVAEHLLDVFCRRKARAGSEFRDQSG